MQSDSLDRDFHVFRQSRDPAALAAVFDAAAPRLLLVAMHLCRDAATAEDLVQTVFLQVLRDVDRFDPRRPMLPWLLAMLEHRASDHRQRAHVRREQPAAGEALAKGASPERLAVDAEVRERVAEALAGMPRDYRDVLTLRLVHGLSPVEIAHAHGMAPATVRTRLRRGLELLRGALPRGLATRGLLALLAAELAFARDGMAAVRTKVLAAATAGTGATFAVGWWLTIAATFALGAGSWWWFAPNAATALRSDADAIATVAAPEASAGRRTRDGDAGASATQTGPDRTAVADPRTTTVRGRVVHTTTDAPMAGVVVTTHTYPVSGSASEPDWREPAAVTSAADGAFSVQFVPSRHRYFELLFNADGFVEEALSFDPLKNGVDVDAGDVKLRPGTPVRLRLTADGKPLGGVETYANHSPDGERPNGMRGYGVSDSDGVVDLGMCPPGAWWHDVRTAHLGHEARFDVPLQRAPLDVPVELREPPRERSISGVLLDTRGVPVAGIDLALRVPRGVWGATTRTDGRFLWALAVLPPGSVREQIELPRNKRGDFEWVDNGGDVAWGTHDLRLVVRRRAPATLRLEVFDAATQQPVEAFGATCKAEIGSGSAEPRRVAIEQHAGGVATFEVAPGAWYASVFPGTPFAESAEIAVQLFEGQTTTLRVPLQPPATLDADVVDVRTGAPLEGVELLLAKVVPPDSARALESAWYQLFLDRPGTSGHHSKGAVIALTRGVSGETGRVSLRAPADVPGLVLIAGGARCIDSEHHGIVLPADGARTTIRVTPAASVTGLVTPRAFVERFGPEPERLAEAATKARTEWIEPDEFADDYPCVVLRSAGDAASDKLSTYVAADGAFTLGGVPAGRYTVHVDAVLGNCQTDLGVFATIDVDPAHPGEPLTLDVSALVPTRGTVRYFVDGEPATGKGGLARLVDGGTNRVTFPLAADGTATTPWLVPGTYVPFVETSSGAPVWGTGRLVVSVGSSIDATFSLQRRAVTITMVEANGEPARDVFLRAEPIDDAGLLGVSWCTWLQGRRSDGEGRIALDPVPPGRLRLRAFARDQDLRTSDVEPALLLGEVAADANAATFRMPPESARR